MQLPFGVAGVALAALACAQQVSGSGAEYGLRFIQPAPGLAEMVAFNDTGLAFVGCADVGCELYWLAEFGFVPPQLVIDIEEGFGSSYPRELKPNGSVLYFAAATSALGAELYRWDISQGVAAAAVSLLADAAPGAASSSPSGLCVLGGLLLFSATLDASSVGTELYAYDPAAPGRGVFLAADVAQGAGASSWPSSITAFGGRAYFSAATAEFGAELWAFDPASRSASLVQDINPGPKSSHPVDLRPFNGRLYFQAAHNGTGTELYSLLLGRNPPVDIVADIDDGIAADADELADEMASSYPQQLTPVGRGALYFAASTVHNGTELWVMDGQTEAVRMVADLDPGPPTSSPSSLTDLNGTLVWAAHDAAYGRELRVLLPAQAATGGAPGGAATALAPTLLADIAPGPASSDPAFLVALHGYLYFTAFNASAMSMGFYMYALPSNNLPLPSLPPTPSPSASETATGTATASSSASESASESATASAASRSPTAAAPIPGAASGLASASASPGASVAASVAASVSASSPTPAASPSFSASRTPASGSASGSAAASGSPSGSVSPSGTHSAGSTPSAHASRSITPSHTHSPRASSPFYGSRSRTPTRGAASGSRSATPSPVAGGVVADDAASGAGGGSGGPPAGARADDGGSGGVTATVVIVVLLAALGGGGFFVYHRYPAAGAAVRRRLGLAPAAAASVQQLSGDGDGHSGSGGAGSGASARHASTDGHLSASDGGPEDAGGDPSAPVAYFASPPRPDGATGAPGAAASAAALSFAAGSGARLQAGRRQERGRLRDAADEDEGEEWRQHGMTTPQARFPASGPLSAAQGAADAETGRQPWQSPLQATVVPVEWKPPATAAEYEW
jgi:ELWxxDGT repeat protein